MPEIKTYPVTKLERLIMKEPLLTEDHDFKAVYQCSCGKDIAYYDIGRPEKLIKCFDCMFGGE